MFEQSVNSTLPDSAKRIFERLNRLVRRTHGHPYDELTTAVIRNVLGPHSNSVDAGCHEGAILDAVLAQAPLGIHFAFEPLPEFAERLRTKYLGRMNVQVHACALSSGSGTTTFHQNIEAPAYSGIKRRKYPESTHEVRTFTVSKCQLDDVVPPDHHISFIKIDVEGGEYDLLRGAARILRLNRPTVVFEFGLGAADYYGTTPDMMFQLLSNAGLAIYPLDSCARGPLDRAGFERQFNRRLNYYFCATAAGTRPF